MNSLYWVSLVVELGDSYAECCLKVQVIKSIFNVVYIFGRNRVRIGNHSGLGEGFHIQNSELEVGDYVMTGPDIMVLGGGHVFKSKHVRIGSQGNLPKTKLKIEDDVWIGARVTILGNCSIIGKGAVVGACSVVTKDVPEYAIVAGNPARIIGYRE